MRSYVKLIAVPALVLAAACQSKDDSKLDDALSKDLALASQVQPYQPQQFVSPQEMGYNGYAPNGQPMQYQAAQRAGGYYQQAPVYQAPAQRTRTVYRSSGTSASRGTAREPVRHTARDAAIGAAAGTVIGVVTTKDKVKGGVVGAAAGAVLGGIIGHTMDVKH